MEHYDIVRWTDFVRGVAPEEDQAAMQRHLGGTCPICLPVAEFLGKLLCVCSNLVRYQAPESAVRLGKALFPMQRPEKANTAIRIPVRLIYDSFLAPAPVGLRAGQTIGRQVIYEAGDCSLDLRVEPQSRSSLAALVGQISSPRRPGLQVANIPVCVRSGKAAVARTLSNEFGEFQMEYEQKGRLRLRISLVGDAKYIDVPLKRLSADRPVGATG